jgi:cellulose biosynthesis protein BcsQ
MALANFAWILAANGQHVLAIDWDLEAPGLHRYFRPFLVDPELVETDGLIDMFWSLAGSALETASARDKETTTAGSVDAADGADIVEALEDATRQLDHDFAAGGYIDFIGAGRQGGTYSERVTSFDWRRFYELGGARTLNAAKNYLRSNYHWVLIDSRTGVSDSSGICTIQMPDTVVPCFTLNRQSIEGVAAILQSIRSFHSSTKDGIDGSAINFFPVATRIENAEQKRLEVARTYARKELRPYLPRAMDGSEREYWDAMEIAYKPAYAFEEVLAAYGESTGAAGAKDTLATQMESMAQRITGNARLKMPEIVDEDRNDVLAKYALGTPSAQTVISGDQVSTFNILDTTIAVGTVLAAADADTDFLRGVRAKEQQWRSSEYLWTLLLSRRELDLLTDQDVLQFGRNMSYYYAQSRRMQQILRRADLGFVLFIGLALVIGVVVFLIGPYYFLWSTLFGAVAAFVGVWFSLAFLWTLTVAGDRPYGISLASLFAMTLFGPFRRAIRDY